jgi:hypothetical protein
LFDFVDINCNPIEGRIVAFGARHLEQLARVLESRGDGGQPGDGGFERFLFLAQLLRALLVVPDRGIGKGLLDRAQALLFALEVKDTSAARRTGWRGP